MAKIAKRNYQEKRKTVKKVLINWCEISTVHAIPRIRRSKNSYLRFLWLLCFAASAIYCIYSIVVSFQAYFKYETLTSIEIIKESQSNFPAVSFCNFKMLNKLSKKNFKQSQEHSTGEDIYDYVNENLLLMQSTSRAELNESTDFRKLVSLNINDILISCVYNRRKCWAKDFKSFFHPIHGICFSFNNNNGPFIKNVSLQGPDDGLSLELFMGTHNEQTESDFNDGIILVVHNQSNVPFFDSDRILVSTGTETDLKINRNFVSKLGLPYSLCIKNNTEFNSEFRDYIVKDLNKTYSQQHCYLICLQKHVIDECNCSSIWLPLNYKNTKFCNYKKIDCISSATRSKIFYQKVIKECMKICPLECDFIEYKITSSKVSFPSENYKRQLIKKYNSSGVSHSKIQNSLIKINIFYESMSYNMIKETESLTRETLFANIGGTLSLTLGISISSIIEIAELFFSLIQVYRDKRAKQVSL